MKLLAIMPARNELASLPSVLAELAEVRPGLELLVVDDGSVDNTGAWLAQAGIRHVRLVFPLGVGGAMRAGLRYAYDHGFSYALRLDADGQHPPQEIDHVLAPILRGETDAACGSRFLGGNIGRVSISRRIAQKGLARSLTLLTRQAVTDPTSGFWAFGPSALQFLARHHPTGYPEPELHLLLHRNGLGIREVSVNMRPRMAGDSSLTPGRALLALARAALAMVVVPLRTVVSGDANA